MCDENESYWALIKALTWVAATLTGCNDPSSGGSNNGNNGLSQSGSFNGNWQGTGYVSNPDGSDKTTCTSMTLQIQQTIQTFAITGGQFNCGVVTATYGPATFEIQGTNLVQGNGVVVGSINATTAQATVAINSTTWTFSMSLGQNGMTYNDSTASGGATIVSSGIFQAK